MTQCCVYTTLGVMAIADSLYRSRGEHFLPAVERSPHTASQYEYLQSTFRKWIMSWSNERFIIPLPRSFGRLTTLVAVARVSGKLLLFGDVGPGHKSSAHIQWCEANVRRGKFPVSIIFQCHATLAVLKRRLTCSGRSRSLVFRLTFRRARSPLLLRKTSSHKRS